MKKQIIVLSSVALLVVVLYEPLSSYFRDSFGSPRVGKYHESRRSEMMFASGPPLTYKKSAAKKPLAQKPVAELPLFSRMGPSSRNNGKIPERRRTNPYPIPKRIDLGHIEGKGVGYDTGYTKLSMIMGPEYRLGHHMTLLDLRGVVFDDGKFAANAGFIGRYLPKSACAVFGWNLSTTFVKEDMGISTRSAVGLRS